MSSSEIFNQHAKYLKWVICKRRPYPNYEEQRTILYLIWPTLFSQAEC